MSDIEPLGKGLSKAERLKQKQQQSDVRAIGKGTFPTGTQQTSLRKHKEGQT